MSSSLRRQPLSPTPPAGSASAAARAAAGSPSASLALGGANSTMRQTHHQQQHRATSPTGTVATTTETKKQRASDKPQFHPRVAASRGTTFLRDTDTADQVLPMPLPKGMPFAAAFTSFEDLVSRDILIQSEDCRVHLSVQDARIIFEAKCADQGLKPCWERELRFLELVSANCQGMLFALRENGLGQHSAAAIAHVLGKNVHFALLDISGNKLGTDGGFEVAKMLDRNDSLVHLNLRSNDIGPEAVGAIADSLTRNNTVTSIDLGGISGVSRNHIGTFGAKAIGEMLKVNKVMCMLGLSSSGLGAEGVRMVADGLAENFTLAQLELSNNNIGHVGAKELCRVITNSTLTRLDLAGNGIGDRGAIYVARAYKLGTAGCGALQRLILDGNGIGPAGAAELGVMAATNPTLTVLSLNNNPLAEGIIEIADKLRDNRMLKELYLQGCTITEEGAVALSFALSRGAVLERLDMSKNRTGDAGARAFAANLSNKSETTQTLTRLKFLDLTGSAIGNRGGLDLAKMVSENSTLTELILRQNLIGGDVGNAFDEAFKRSGARLQPNGNQTLLLLDLSFNDIPFQAHSKIEASLQRNRARHKEGTVPRLRREIEDLVEQQSDLFSKETEIEAERRSNRDKTEEIARRRDQQRSQADQYRRFLAELTEEVQAAQAVHNQKKEEMREVDERLSQERQKMEGRLTHLNHKVESERDKKERIFKEIDKLRKQLKARQDADDEALRPSEEEFRVADDVRNRAKSECKAVAEQLARLHIDILKATLKVPGVLPNPLTMGGRPPAPPQPAAAAATNNTTSIPPVAAVAAGGGVEGASASARGANRSARGAPASSTAGPPASVSGRGSSRGQQSGQQSARGAAAAAAAAAPVAASRSARSSSTRAPAASG